MESPQGKVIPIINIALDEKNQIMVNISSNNKKLVINILLEVLKMAVNQEESPIIRP